MSPVHNLPLADAANLTKLKDAVAAVRSGDAKPVESDGNLEYKFNGFSLLLSQQVAAVAGVAPAVPLAKPRP